MKLNVTRQKLFNANAEIDAIAATGIGLLLSDKVDSFYKKNGAEIKKTQVKIIEMQKKHIVFEGEKMVFPERKEDDTSPTVPVFKLGSSAEIVQAEYRKIMDEKVTIEV